MIITVKHNFETAHRLPFLKGKCQNIHGHSWWVEWAFEAPMDENGLTIDFGIVKKELRSWVDKYLDHGAMLGMDDPLHDLLFYQKDQKVFPFGMDHEGELTYGLPWPTVEAVATMLARLAHERITKTEGAKVHTVTVTEKYDNQAIWSQGDDL